MKEGEGLIMRCAQLRNFNSELATSHLNSPPRQTSPNWKAEAITRRTPRMQSGNPHLEDSQEYSRRWHSFQTLLEAIWASGP